MKLLVTRPEPDAARTAAALRARGHDVLVAPLTRIEPVAADLGPGPWAALLFSSANAPRALENHPRYHELKGMAVFAIGRHTEQAARATGFADVSCADGAIDDLVALVADRHHRTGQPLLYLAGFDRAGDLAADLAARRITVEVRVIYRAIADAKLPVDVAAALDRGELDGVLHYSRRSAEIFLDATMQPGRRAAALAVRQFCLSARIAEPLIAAGATDVCSAARPAEDFLVKLIESA